MEAKFAGNQIQLKLSPEESSIVTQILMSAMETERGEYDARVDEGLVEEDQEVEDRILTLENICGQLVAVNDLINPQGGDEEEEDEVV